MIKERLQSGGTPSSTVIRRFSLVSYPLTPRVNYQITFSYNIHALPSKQVMEILKLIW